jgi:hypothetical protein
MPHKKFAQTLKRININNPVDASFVISMEDYDFFDKYERQNGGSKEKNYVISYKFEGNKYQFKIYQSSETDRITYSVHNNDDENDPQCITIFYDIAQKCCYIENISVHQRCYRGMEYSKKGTLLMKFVLEFIENYIAAKHMVKYIQLKDNSKKICNSIKELINLDSFYMFVYGDTWYTQGLEFSKPSCTNNFNDIEISSYGKYGFVPFDNVKNNTNLANLKAYQKNQEIVKNTLVKDVDIKNIFANAIKEANKKTKTGLKYQDADKILEKYKDKTIQKFMKDLAKYYDKTCAVFYYLNEKLILELDMRDLHGMSYWKKLSP